MARKVLIEFRRDTAAHWTATNPTLASGEPGFETDTGKFKIGDGATAWTGLAYIGAGGSGTVSNITSTGGTITVTSGAGPTANVDLPNSGVGAGAYGDSTHVGQFTVSADGIITAANAVAIAGGAANLTVLFDSTLGGSAASIDTGANGIAQTTAHLLIVANLRTDQATNFATINWTFNGDTGNNYGRQTLRGRGTTASAAVGGAVGAIQTNAPGTSLAAGFFGSVWAIVPVYTSSSVRKTLLEIGAQIDTNTANADVHLNAGSWNNTAAINQITVASSSGNLIAGSRLTIYGSG